jgi:hypothetical protein
VQCPFFGGKVLIRFATEDALTFIGRPGYEDGVLVNPGFITDEDVTRIHKLHADINLHALAHASEKETPHEAAHSIPDCSRDVLNGKQNDPDKFE